MIKIVGIAILSITLLVGCATSEQPIIVTLVPDSTTPVPLCPFEYSSQWNTIVGSQVKPVTSGDLFDEVTAIVEELYPDPYPRARGIEVYMVQHPDDPETIFVECDQIHWSHGHVETVLLRRTGKEWVVLRGLNYGAPWPVILDIDLFGFVWECEGWSLYAGSLNTEYMHGGARPENVSFAQSRDNGESWQVDGRVHHGRYSEPLPSPPLPSPFDATLATAHYNQEQERFTRFAYVEHKRTLYALTYSATPTPMPLPSPTPGP